MWATGGWQAGPTDLREIRKAKQWTESMIPVVLIKVTCLDWNPKKS
jgi:hypothetical protein